MELSREIRQLFDACAEGNVAIVTSLLDGGVDVNSTDDDDVTALQLAAANGQEQIVRLLLMRGAAVEQANFTGWTPLLHAARHGHSAVAALLIQNHANISAQTCYGAGLACLAARSGNLNTCRLLEGAGLSFAASSHQIARTATSTLEISPLIVAAYRGHDSVMKHLLSSTDVNGRVKPTGVTALMSAAVGGHVSTARLLVERGKADINAVDINDKCALDFSIAQDKDQVKEYLEAKTTRSRHHTLRHAPPSIIEAVKSGKVDLVSEILERDIGQRDACMPQDGATPLIFSAMLGHLHIVKLLVEKGCNVNAQDTVSGWTALMQAIFHGCKEVAVFLLQAGAGVAIPAKNGCTAFDMASIISDVDTELYRLLAARALPVTVAQHGGISARNHMPSAEKVNQMQKTGVKAWWSRVSKRFHNLKQQESVSSSRHELTEIGLVSDGTLRMRASTGQPTNDAEIKSLTVNPLAVMLNASSGPYPNLAGHTVKTDVMFSLDVTGMMSRGNSATTSMSVMPPVFPTPAFHADRTAKMPPASLRKPLSNQSNLQALSLIRPASSHVKLLQNQHSTLNLVNRVASPPPRVQFAKRPAVKVAVQVNVSPSASCDAGTLGGSGSGDAVRVPTSKAVLSSTSSSTLTAGSDNNGKTSPSTELKRTRHRKLPNDINPKATNGRTSELSKHKLHDFNKAIHSIKTDVPPATKPFTVVSGRTEHQLTRHASECDASDLAGMLQKLSLECYQSIFEEQEVDMEAFLTLTDGDLNELGIPSAESRRQILAAVSEMNASKDRERQLYQKVMANFSSTLHSAKSEVDSVANNNSEINIVIESV